MSDQMMMNSLASIDRLMQRLVVLFEASAQNGGGSCPDEGGSGGQGKQNQQPPSQPASQPQQTGKTKQALEFVNELFDGSKQINSHTRQFFSNMSQVFSTVASQGTRLESAAARAAAAYKGQYTTAQAVSETVNFAASSIRNVAQYGYAVGGLMSAWDGFTRLVQHNQQKLEAAVRIAAANEAAERGRALTRFSVANPNLSPAEIGLKKLEEEEKALSNKALKLAELVEKREAALRAMADEAQKHAVDPLAGPPAFAVTTEYDARIKRLKNELETENSEEEQEKRNQARLNLIEDLKKLETQRAQSAEIAPINNRLQIELQKTYLEGERANYEKIKQQIEHAREATKAVLSLGTNAEHFETLKLLMQLDIADQKNAITEATEKHNEAIYRASQELSLDSEGNINKEETVKKVKDLTEKFRETISKLAIKITDITYEDIEDSNLVDSQGNKVKVRKFFYKGQPVKITAEQAKALEEAAAAASQSVADKATDLQNQLIDLGQQIETAKSDDAIKDVTQRLRDAIMKITDETKLARSEILGLYIDPTSQVANKKREIERIISEHKKELKGAITDAEKQYITAELTKYELALKAISADETLQSRALAGVNYDRASDAYGIELSDAQTSQSLKHQQQSADLERSAALEQELRGNVGKAKAQKRSFELQRAQFAEAQKLRQEEINKQEELLKIAVKDGADQEKIIQIKKKIVALYDRQKQALAAQVSELIRQNASVQYRLKDDKPTFDRARLVRRLGPKLRGIGLKSWPSSGSPRHYGSERARLTSDFEEYWRKRYGKLTKEEAAQAKQERKLNNRLHRAIIAVEGDGKTPKLLRGGSAKQRALVAYYREHAGKKDEDIVKIVQDGFNAANKALYKIADIPESSSKATSK